jgi:hypothetical protein
MEIEKRAVEMPDGEQARALFRRTELLQKQLRTDPISDALARLKDLAAWRLYREENQSVAGAEGLTPKGKAMSKLEAANRFASNHRKRLNPKEARAFRDAKPKGDKPANEADLFGEESDPFEVQRRAWTYLGELMPDEFVEISDAKGEMFVKLEKLASEGQE